MDGIESFLGFDRSEGMSEAAFEVFKEQMKAAAAQIAAIKKEESKQKKKEDELVKILLKFVKTSQKHALVALISRALEQNIPANFLLAIILLNNKEIMPEVGAAFMLKAGEGTEPDANNDGQITANEREQSEEKAMVFFRDDESLPLKIRIELDAWMKSLLFQAEENPQKLLKTAYDTEVIEHRKDADSERITYEEKRTLKTILTQLSTFVLRDFLEQNKIEESYEKLVDFCKFLLQGILEKVAETLKNRNLLK